MSSATVTAGPMPVARSRLPVIFGGLMLVVLLAALDQTIVTTALPTIVSDLGGLNRFAWVTSAFLLAQTAVIPIYGKLGDLYGRRRILQSAVVVFLIGSALCGLANGMTELIAFRAVQGLGAGGLIVLANAVIGDVVPPRERGRYQGLFGAVFGFASIAGPLLGGLIVEAASWRWIFFVNVPLGLLALVVLSTTLPATQPRQRPVIDYLGAGLLAVGLSAIVLVASLGGTTWDWGSAQVVLTSALGVALLALFVAVERRAREPVVPRQLLRNRVYAVAGAMSFIVGFAMFGSVTFLPLFFQTVHGASPTGAGLRLVPMMAGLLVMSIASGQIISRTGHYRVFPIIGMAAVAAGLFLLSRLDMGTSVLTTALYLLVLGLGLGSVMQVLVLAVQNAVDYRFLGAATSGVTLYRGIGGSIGAATFGAIFSSRLTSELQGVLTGRLAQDVENGARLSGSQLDRLAAPARMAYEQAYVNALRPVFVAAACVALAGFVLSWLLPARPLRETAATSHGLDDSLAVPRSPNSLVEIERALTRLTTPDQRRRFRTRVAERAGIALGPGATWALVRIDEHGFAGARAAAEQDGVPPERIAEVVDELRGHGLIAGEGGGAHLTGEGRTQAERAVAARRQLLTEAIADDTAERDPAVNEMLVRLSRELAGEAPS